MVSVGIFTLGGEFGAINRSNLYTVQGATRAAWTAAGRSAG